VDFWVERRIDFNLQPNFLFSPKKPSSTLFTLNTCPIIALQVSCLLHLLLVLYNGPTCYRNEHDSSVFRAHTPNPIIVSLLKPSFPRVLQSRENRVLLFVFLFTCSLPYIRSILLSKLLFISPTLSFRKLIPCKFGRDTVIFRKRKK